MPLAAQESSSQQPDKPQAPALEKPGVAAPDPEKKPEAKKPAEPKKPNPGSVAARILEGDPELDIGGFLGTRAATLEGFL